MQSETYSLFFECTQIVDQLAPLFRHKFTEYEQVERLVKNAVVRSQLTGKSVSITEGIQQFIDALIKSSQLEEEASTICKQIDEIAHALLSGTIAPTAARSQLNDLKSQLLYIRTSYSSVYDEMNFSKKRIRREITT